MNKNIESMRKDKNLTQDYVAKYLGITRQTFSKLEKGSIEPTLGQAVKLSELLGIEIDDLIKTDTKVEAKKTIDWGKYKQIITNFITFGADEDGKITKTKLAKLCYLLDFTWYYYNLEPITGLEYKKFAQGPVPDAYFSTLDELFEEGEINVKIKGPAYLIENIEKPNHDKLNDDEFGMLQNIAKKWKGKRTNEIVDFTHNQLPWLVSYDKEIIPYGLITQEDLENVY